MKGIKREDSEAMDVLLKSAASARGVALLEIQIKLVVRLRKLLSASSSCIGKELVCAEIVQRYMSLLLQWLIPKEKDEMTPSSYSSSLSNTNESSSSLVQTGRAKVLDDILWIITSIINSSVDFSNELAKLHIISELVLFFFT